MTVPYQATWVPRVIALSLVATGAGPARAAEFQNNRGPSDWVTHAVSGTVRELDSRRSAIMDELEPLPRPAGVATSARLGWHSRILRSPDQEVWVEVDLGGSYPLDLVALVPASGEAITAGGAGYGFPPRFRIEISDEPDWQRRELVCDQTSADLVNPGALPFVAELGGKRARLVRVTVIKPWRRKDDWIVAFGEMMVISGQRKVAARRPVNASAAPQSAPAWLRENLTDGQSVLGAPVAREESATNGYLAARDPAAGALKWVQVDLGRAVPIDEVRLFPARPVDFADVPGYGFPERFRIEAAAEADFAQPMLLFATDKPFGNPGDNPVAIPVAATARFVRVTALELHNLGAVSSFALAEMQVWSGDTNFALGAPVTALDAFSDARFPRWHPAFLVDGFTSRQLILDLPGWLRGLDRRRVLEQEIARIDLHRATAADAALEILGKVGAGFATALLAGAGLLVWRGRLLRRQAVEALRQRIASDLHDEIGSHLGSIALLSEVAQRQTPAEQARSDFAEIGGIAARTNEALREIVWFIDARPITRADLVARMRETAAQMLRGIESEFHAPEPLRAGTCSLEFARHTWLIFKEALHNACKHAGPTRVSIRVSEPEGGFRLQMTDDGCGFHETELCDGHGLQNLRRRAAQLGAKLRISSAPGAGTTIDLLIPRS